MWPVRGVFLKELPSNVACTRCVPDSWGKGYFPATLPVPGVFLIVGRKVTSSNVACTRCVHDSWEKGYLPAMLPAPGVFMIVGRKVTSQQCWLDQVCS